MAGTSGELEEETTVEEGELLLPGVSVTGGLVGSLASPPAKATTAL